MISKHADQRWCLIFLAITTHLAFSLSPRLISTRTTPCYHLPTKRTIPRRSTSLLAAPHVAEPFPLSHQSEIGSLSNCDLIETNSLHARWMVWDSGKSKWNRLPYDELEQSGKKKHSAFLGPKSFIAKFIKHTFVPEGVSQDYFRFTKWRCFQRLVSAMVNVFGTQAMLLALGIRTQGALGTAAAVSWVLKDALGKLCRIFWASRMSRRFDSDAKRWRFRSSILYAFGSGLEIVTYIFPAAFLAIATGANCLKQISMLTSSATRSAIYRSFADGNNNIGEISARGEAQIAVVDLFGIAIGIKLSKALGTDPKAIALAYLALQSTDTFAVYREIRAVVFKGLNFERTMMILNEFIASDGHTVLHPSDVAQNERIFRPPRVAHGTVFTTVSDVTFPPASFSDQSLIRGREHDDSNNSTSVIPMEVRLSMSPFVEDKCAVVLDVSGDAPRPAILVHKDARSPDIFTALHVFAHLEKILLKHAPRENHNLTDGSGGVGASSPSSSWGLSCEEAVRLATEARGDAHRNHEGLLQKMQEQGWETGRYMYNVPKRIEWRARNEHVVVQGVVQGQEKRAATATSVA